MNVIRRTARRSAPSSMIMALLVPTLALFMVVTNVMAQDMPIQFKMTGQFLEPSKEEKVGGVNAFTVNVLKKTWVWDIDRADTLQGTALGSSVLKQIYPPIMTFVGRKELTEPLIDPWIAGKTYTLTGQLYVKKRIFRLNVVEGPMEEGEAAAEADPP